MTLTVKRQALYELQCDGCGRTIEQLSPAPPAAWIRVTLPHPRLRGEYGEKETASIFIRMPEGDAPAKTYHLCFKCAKYTAQRIEARDLAPES